MLLIAGDTEIEPQFVDFVSTAVVMLLLYTDSIVRKY